MNSWINIFESCYADLHDYICNVSVIKLVQQLEYEEK